MDQKVRISRWACLLASGGLVLGLASAAQAQLRPGSQQGLGLTGAATPAILQKARAAPYNTPADCRGLTDELKALDTVLGPEVDQLKTQRTKGDMAAGYVRGMVPYRGVVRFLTGADSKDRELQAAVSAGYARRGFLHGLQWRCVDEAAGVRIASAEASTAHAVDVDARVRVTDARLDGSEARLKTLVVAADDAPATGERLGAEMVRGPAPPAPIAPGQPGSSQVVYRLVDTASGRAILPDESEASTQTSSGSGR
jgi:hypothetical protein